MLVETSTYVPHDSFTDAAERIEKLLDMVPVDEGRKFKFPALVGPMGIGKTRTCEEISRSFGSIDRPKAKLYWW